MHTQVARKVVHTTQVPSTFKYQAPRHVRHAGERVTFPRSCGSEAIGLQQQCNRSCVYSEIQKALRMRVCVECFCVCVSPFLDLHASPAPPPARLTTVTHTLRQHANSSARTKPHFKRQHILANKSQNRSIHFFLLHSATPAKRVCVRALSLARALSPHWDDKRGIHKRSYAHTSNTLT